MNSYKKQANPHYQIDHRQWENDINSFIPDISIAPLEVHYFQRRSKPQQLTLCRSLHAEALQAPVSEGLAQGPWRGGQNEIRTHALPVQIRLNQCATAPHEY